MSKTLVYKFLQNYISAHDHGIFLLPLPTGYGKTYSSLDYITDQVIAYYKKELKQKPKFIFVTNLIKNLKKEDFEEMFANKGYPDLYEKEFAMFQNNIDNIVENFEKVKLPVEICITESCRKLKKKIKSYKSYDNPRADLEIKDLYKKMVGEAERDFRKDVRKYLKDELKNSPFEDWNQVLKSPEQYPKYLWIFQLYPTAYIYSKSVLVMSMDKFLLPIDPIFKKSFILYDADPEFTENRTVFIDEVDASKEVMINRIVDVEFNRYINQIELFVKIHDNFEKKEFPSDIMEKSKGSFSKDLDKLYKKGDAIYEKYNLNNGNIRISEELRKGTNFLFHDGVYFTALDQHKGRTYYAVNYDQEINCNIISVVTEKPENELGDLLRGVRNFITETSMLLTSMATAFMLRKNKEKRNEHMIEFESALRTVLAEMLYLSDEETEYMVQKACQHNNSRLKSTQHVFDGSFYENGFALNEFLDDEKHLLRTEIAVHQINLTPEKIMAEIGARYRVIGLSATAEVRTDINNYHWRYIKKHLKDEFVSLSKDEMKLLEQDYNQSIAGYDKIDLKAITADVIVEKMRVTSGFSDLFERAPIIAMELEKYIKMHYGQENNFILKRYARLFCAYAEFLENIKNYEMDSMLYLAMKLPKKGDVCFDLDFIRREFSHIHRLYDIPLGRENDFSVVLTGDNYNSDRERILKELSDGKKRFIMSSYKTIGAGQNLDFIPPAGKNIIRVGKQGDSRIKKDIDSIFLEAPTGALESGMENEKAALKAIVQLEYLKENGELTDPEFESKLKSIIQKNGICKKAYSSIPSIRKYYDLLIIQALGRICRSVVKSPVIRVYISEDIFKFFFKNEILHDKIIPTPELKAVFALCDKQNQKEPDFAKEMISAAATRSNEYASLLRTWIYKSRQENGAWREDAMEEYKKDGELALKCLQPDLSSYENDYQNSYIVLPEKTDRYYYNYSGDYGNIRISLSPKQGNDIFPYCVSVEDSRVDLFLKWKGFKEYMEKLGYQTEFKTRADIWPSPAAFNNIYKGRIGEVFGRYLFESLGIELEEITEPETFELFDYKVKGKNVYIDFKNRKDAFYVEDKDMIAWIRHKKELLGNVSVIICNIYEETGAVWEYKGGIITIPSLVRDFNSQQLDLMAVKKILEVCNADK